MSELMTNTVRELIESAKDRGGKGLAAAIPIKAKPVGKTITLNTRFYEIHRFHVSVFDGKQGLFVLVGMFASAECAARTAVHEARKFQNDLGQVLLEKRMSVGNCEKYGNFEIREFASRAPSTKPFGPVAA